MRWTGRFFSDSGPSESPRQSRPRASILAAAAALLIAGSIMPAMAETGLAAFLATYRCSVVERLAAIHARGNRAREHGRFLILAPVRHPDHYVQCAFFDDDKQMMCEAASGFYSEPEGVSRHAFLAPAALAALARLGFSTDASHGNFQRVMDTRDASGLASVADLLLSALHDAYGVRLHSRIEARSPLAPELGRTLSASACALVS